MDDAERVRRRAATVDIMRTAARFRPVHRPLHRTVVAGRYVLLDQIGAGGMGSVWRAHDERTGTTVALKVLGQHSGALLLRFVREQAVRVHHPHVVAPTGWAAEDDLVVLSMDLVAGGSVQDLLDRHGPFPVGYVAVLVEQLLLALAAVHAAGLVHRDVKPANLLLEATGDAAPHLRLGDFGVAAPIADVRFTTVPGAIGTDGYMAPEQARGALPDPTQDLYAVGRVALQLLTGLTPERQGAIGSHPLRPLLERLLVLDPEQRLVSAEVALRLLRRLAITPEVGPPVPDVLSNVDHFPTGWHRWAAWGVLVACLGVVGLCISVTVGVLI